MYLVGHDEEDGLVCVLEVWCEVILEKVWDYIVFYFIFGFVCNRFANKFHQLLSKKNT
jgi:hypothetical protein